MSLLDYYHIAQTPSGVHIHRLDPLAVLERAKALRADDPELTEPEAVAEVHGEIVDAIRTSLGFPIRGRWFSRDGWDSQLTVGEPHPTLMAAATVHDALPASPHP